MKEHPDIFINNKLMIRDLHAARSFFHTAVKLGTPKKL